MSLSGSGIGGSIGGPQQYSQTEIEATAWTLVNKERLGVVKDTVEIPFTQVGGNVWKYSTDSGRPTLMPLGSTRTTTGEEEKPDESWKDFYDQLLNKLPPQIKSRIQSELGKSFEFRNANYIVLDQALAALAKGMGWMESVEEPIKNQTAESERLLNNQALPGKALRGVIQHSKAQLEGAESYLDQVGPNDPNHDKLRYFTKASGNLHRRMNELLEILRDPGESLPTQKQQDRLNQDIGALYKEFNAVSQGPNLLIMGTLLETMEGVAQALSMTPTSPSLFLGLKTALKGIFKSESEAGIIGKDLEALLLALQNGMAASLMKKLGAAKLKMLLMMLIAAWEGLGTLASILSNEGMGKLPAKDEQEENEGKKFSFLLIMELLESSEFIKFLLNIIAKACGQNEDQGEISADLLELPIVLLMLLTAGQGKAEKTSPLFEEMSSDLSKKMARMDKFIKESYSEESNEGESANEKNLKLTLQQGLIALKSNESEGLFFALEGALEKMGSSMEGLKKDLMEMQTFAKFFKYSVGLGLKSETKASTAMIHSA